MKDDSNNFGLGSLGDAMKNLQDIYAGGLEAMNQASEVATKDINPTHKIIIDVKNTARVEGHDYKIDAHLEFLADLNSILNSESGNISALLEGLDVDLSDEESNQVAEQLGKPRCIGKLDNFKINEIELHGEKEKIEDGINKKGTLLIMLEKNKVKLSFESVFALPELQTKQTLYYAIPSQEKMQENIVLKTDNLDKKVTFEWIEKDKDNLKVDGSAKIITI